MDVAIIGLGAFGSWLLEQYLEMGMRVKVYDSDPEKMLKASREGVRVCGGVQDAVRDVEAVILAVPIHTAPKVVEEVSRYMSEGAVVDLSSLKRQVYWLLKGLPAQLRPVCIHPLFGPASRGFEGKKVALIPVRDPEEERRLAEKIMPGAEFVETSLDEHEEAMTYVLSLTHLLSIVLVDLLSSAERDLARLSGTSFRKMCEMMGSVMSESPETLASIVYCNEGSQRILERLIVGLRELSDIMRSRGLDELKRKAGEAKNRYSKLLLDGKALA